MEGRQLEQCVEKHGLDQAAWVYFLTLPLSAVSLVRSFNLITPQISYLYNSNEIKEWLSMWALL